MIFVQVFSEGVKWFSTLFEESEKEKQVLIVFP